jgi:hypothetical protein
MTKTIEIILEIVKYTLPALVVFLTVYFMLKSHFKHLYEMEIVRFNQQKTKRSLPLRLQAYERLALFLERIDIPKLIMRLQSPNLSAKDMENALIVSIQKEFEHNLAQQIYVSEQLWQIITIAKEQALELVTRIGSNMESETSAQVYSRRLIEEYSMQKINPVKKALAAINKEIKILL